LRQPGLSHPEKLRFDRGKSILWVIIRTANEIQELAVKLGRRRGNNFQIGKHPVVNELLSDLTEQVPLSLVPDMVDGEPSDNDIERSKRRQRVIQAPLPYVDPMVAVESISGMSEHGWRRVHSDDALDAWATFKNKSSQSAVTATQVEHGAR
jgi:hypothetical protein